MNTFSGSASIRAGWETFKKRPWFFVGVTVIIAAISAIAGQFTSASAAHPQTAVIVVGAGYLISFLVSTLVKMGSINLFLKAHDADVGQLKFEDLWAPRHFIPFLLTSILLGIIVIVGLILLIVPGIIFALRYMFAPYLVVDRGLDTIAALKESARITVDHKWRLLGFVVMLVLLNILGLICLIVGLLATIPVSSLAVVHAYRSLAGQKANA